MMIKPGISELSTKADSRYTLVTMAAKRARIIGANSEIELEEDGVKPVSRAIKEIADGTVEYCRGDGPFESIYCPEVIKYSNLEPTSDLNIEALKYELEVAEAEKKAQEDIE